jgi:hypothetical protein
MQAAMFLNKKKQTGNTVLLMHFDGTEGGTTFSDAAKPSRTFTPTGATTTAAQTKFGGTSLYVDGVSGSRLLTPDSTELKLATEWTIEFWTYQLTIGSNTWLFGKNTIGSASCLKTYNGTLYMEPDSGSQLTVATSVMKVNQWQHYAMVNHSGWWYLYIDGVAQIAAANASTMGNNIASLVLGGSAFDGSTSKGYYQEFRISRVARYLSGFTPPASRFTLD